MSTASKIEIPNQVVLYVRDDQSKVVISGEQCEQALMIIKTYNINLLSLTRAELHSCRRIMVGYVGAGAGLGMAGGGILGLAGGPAAPATTPICALVGLILGALGGLFGGLYHAYSINTDRFAEWREKQNRETMKEFLSVFEECFEDGALENLQLIDPVDCSIMDSPFVDSCTCAETIGHVHNYSTWQQLAKDGRPCAGGEKIDLGKLRPYYPSMGKLVQICKYLLENLSKITLSKGEELPKEFRKAIQILHDSITKKLDHYWDMSKDYASKLEKQKKITKRLQAEYMRVLSAMMEPDEPLPFRRQAMPETTVQSSTTTTTTSLALEAPKEQVQDCKDSKDSKNS